MLNIKYISIKLGRKKSYKQEKKETTNRKIGQTLEHVHRNGKETCGKKGLNLIRNQGTSN